MTTEHSDDGDEPSGLFDAYPRVGVSAFGFLLEGYQRLVANVEADLRNETGMSLSELELLIHLGNEQAHRLRPTELAEKCVMSTGGCTRLLDRLEEQRLIERRPHDDDRRGLTVALTEHGRRQLELALPGHFASVDAHLWSVVSDAELRGLANVMRRVNDANRH